MESFLIAINAVTPFMIYIMFGYGVKKMGWTEEAFMKRLNQLVFKSFFPLMMFNNIYTRDRNVPVNVKLIGTAVLTLTILMIALFLIVPRVVEDKPKKGVIIQAIYRSNTVLFAIPLMEHMYGKEGATVATIVVAFMVPIYNVLAVFVLEYYGSTGGKISILTLLKGVAKNPIIDGAVVGFIFFYLNIAIPACVMKPISQFSAMTTPLALFILGATLQFRSMLSHARYIIPTTLVKAFVVPAVMMAIAFALGFGPIERFAIFCLYGTPVAASSYSMAASMGCDGELAGEMVVAGTAFSVISIFIWIFSLNTLGLL